MIRFIKYQGCGNDFVFIDEASAALVEGDISDFARRVCHRRLGVGADGLIICRTKPLTMDIINSDGSIAPMCGNGVRCFARYCVDEGVVSSDTRAFDVHTLSGVVRARVSLEGGFTAEIAMGNPDWSARVAGVGDVYRKGSDEFLGREISVDISGGSCGEGAARDESAGEANTVGVDETARREVRVSSLFLGTYHTVVWLDENEWIRGGNEGILYESKDIDRVGRFLESHPAFTKRTNVDFARVTNRRTVEMITWERGAGLTAACGTGACAVTALGIREGRFDGEGEVRVLLPYGELFIRQDESGEVFMRGPAEPVFRGELYQG
ncbi:MAG: diaminopimelate epimerase [Clostridiales Family XIII bacterium]|jgi:diaminopimelate epimerase|nr:diaminopimelate epimerase [Clostridiales Family XIII bacterium]